MSAPVLLRKFHIPSVALQSLSGLTSISLNGLPFVALLTAIGLLQISIANSAARTNAPWAEWAFWLGLCVVYAPIILRLLMPEVMRAERIGLVVLLGGMLYLAKIANTPIHMGYHDEFAHWRTALDIFNTQHLLQPNPALPVTPLYPGLGSATVVIARLTGLSLFQSGMLGLGVARIVMMLGLFFWLERVSGSSRVAGLGAAIYTANPNYLYFDAQFSYETLALPLALLLAATLVKMVQASNRNGWRTVVVMLIGAITITHHLTAYMTTLFMCLWCAVGLICRHDARYRLPFWVPGIAIIFNGLWLLYVANFTLSYLGYIFSSAFDGVISLVQKGHLDRMPFQGSEGSVAAPLLERLLGLASAGLVLLGLPFGLIEVWRKHRHNAAAVAMGLCGCLNPVMHVLRLTGGGWEVSNRSSEFLFISIGFLIALGLIDLPLPRVLHWVRAQIAVPGLLSIFIGGIVIGWSPWMRLPWPYAVIADYRSVDPQGIYAATWAKEFLGVGRRIATDRVQELLMATYGEQTVVTGDVATTAGLFLNARVGQDERDVLRKTQLEYLSIERRLSTESPLSGFYYQPWEGDIYRHSGPISQRILEKFDHLPNAHRVLDSGDIRIYDVTKFLDQEQHKTYERTRRLD